MEENRRRGQIPMTGLSRAAVERILKKSGAGRVSADATTTLATLMEEYGTFIAKEAKKMSDHTGRKTVRGSDIRLAAEMFK
ncbi:MAG: NFYB/HAP3 family transcription factor subunit [Methanoregula sp.]|nr:NFYB/HAP3 family transcription factor subunit [Methanoregula sp.]